MKLPKHIGRKGMTTTHIVFVCVHKCNYLMFTSMLVFKLFTASAFYVWLFRTFDIFGKLYTCLQCYPFTFVFHWRILFCTSACYKTKGILCCLYNDWWPYEIQHITLGQLLPEIERHDLIKPCKYRLTYQYLYLYLLSCVNIDLPTSIYICICNLAIDIGWGMTRLAKEMSCIN